ncbi:MAG: glycoside hydrolase family 127 protein [Propionicimonas sp.]|nr:glycoside hydrolase family 127 protein [Propionicimonas sp.]
MDIRSLAAVDLIPQLHPTILTKEFVLPSTSLHRTAVTPARPVADVKHSPLDLRAVRLLDSGTLGRWQHLNSTATIPHCIAQVEESGVVHNFRLAAGESAGQHRGPVFADSDLYKVIEAVAWDIARCGTHEFDAWLDEVIALVGRAQEPDGYLDTWIQVLHPEKKWAEMESTHELYVLGHLIQAAIALDRASGRADLLDIAVKFADLVYDRFGPNGAEGICGHPEIETALVELYRQTRDQRYLILASRMVDLRGHGLLPTNWLGPRYFQDHLPVREAREAVGHAVRQLYLNAGVTDVYLESGDNALLSAMNAQWASVHERKMYISGAFGARHSGEAFGDAYELPSDRAYAETCATVADMHWSWRMLLADGDAGPAAYSAAIERELHNALRAAVDATGTRFFYANPLQLRPDRYSEESAPRERVPWYPCACCPPNIARTVAQLSGYVASTTDDTLWLHQFAESEIDLPAHLGGARLTVTTGYPLEGAVEITVDGSTVPGTQLAVRIPEWSGATALNGPDGAHVVGSDGYAHADLVPGATYRLGLDLTARFTRAHHRIDAVRGSLALERGPLLYCIEQADLPAGIKVDDLVLLPAEGIRAHGDGQLTVLCTQATPDEPLYPPAGGVPTSAAQLPVTAVPFSSWGNRNSDAMRVWIPAVPSRADAGAPDSRG